MFFVVMLKKYTGGKAFSNLRPMESQQWTRRRSKHNAMPACVDDHFFLKERVEQKRKTRHPHLLHCEQRVLRF
jgi:stalled ribosome alternative rescue factor ArfA